MGKAALFLTYNSIGDPGDYSNGTLERNGNKAIIVQHPKGQKWGAKLGNGKIPVAKRGEPRSLELARSEKEAQEMINYGKARGSLVKKLYSEAFGLTDFPDYVVVYVGAGGSEGAIELASHVPVERLRFVMCGCNLDLKVSLALFHTGGQDGVFLQCGCGGQKVMAELLEKFFATGLVGPEADLALVR